MQNLQNHRKFYPPHHFVFYPITILVAAFCLYSGVNDIGNRSIWLSLFSVTLLVGWLSFMLRQHYALSNQNRLIRLEMRFRYFVLTNKRFEEYEDKLTFGQIAALRFASDQELLDLLRRTVQENLAPVEIKKAVKNWQADLMRV
ncbi:MAG TPA: DUF6526 family protein [Cytophagaceae bacterium]